MSEPKKSAASGSVPAEPPAYRVLARKYRPSSFEDLIGQDAMVRTISNAFETVRTMASCPIRSSKLAGRYLRASTRYPSPGASAGAGLETADFLGSLIVPSALPPRDARTDREQV